MWLSRPITPTLTTRKTKARSLWVRTRKTKRIHCGENDSEVEDSAVEVEDDDEDSLYEDDSEVEDSADEDVDDDGGYLYDDDSEVEDSADEEGDDDEDSADDDDSDGEVSGDEVDTDDDYMVEEEERSYSRSSGTGVDLSAPAQGQTASPGEDMEE